MVGRRTEKRNEVENDEEDKMLSKENTMLAIEEMYKMFPDAHGELNSKKKF
ncbi:hypothetical protein K4E_12660 [Enterococcus thailandicus]|nr:hypothetical protein K4E_12660 [Enterococcus thailandicus]